MTVPIYAFFICLVVEATLLLIVKTGNGLRGLRRGPEQRVYNSLDPAGAHERSRRAAVRAMVPFASSSSQHADGLPPSLRALLDAEEYKTAARKYAPGLPGGPKLP